MGFPVIGVRVDGCYHPGMQSQDRVSEEPRCGVGGEQVRASRERLEKNRRNPCRICMTVRQSCIVAKFAPVFAHFNTRILKPGNECYPHQHDLYWDKWPIVHLGVCQHQIKRDDIRKDDLWSPRWFVARGRWSCFSPSRSVLRRADERWSAREEEIRRNGTSDMGYVSNLQRCQTLTPYQSLSVYVCNLPDPF